MRTLQTLGSVPDWETGNVFEDSDEEKDTSKTTKKRRCKKRKRKSNAENEGKQQDKVNSPQPPVKKNKPVKKTMNVDSTEPPAKKKKPVKETNKNLNGVGPQLEKNESGAENALSRKQWKNKMKNKRRRVDDSLSNNIVSHKVEDKGKPSKMMKKSHAEKLRRILNNKASEEPEEAKDTTVSLKGDEEQVTPDPSTALRTKMEKRLEAARFRYINELLYTSTSGEAKRMFQQDPEAIAIYHKGYTTQVQHWPKNPVDSIISYIRKK
ncbi:hypothetical protein M9458_030261 [Cirrhinus mrigala]|uniref:Ribosomal RNA-processing protein 8 n=1 Tax=Cirrhinus mrigala TaxID=683832 RepID=A0ABD0PJP5_CIRMR